MGDGRCGSGHFSFGPDIGVPAFSIEKKANYAKNRSG